jgi:hypothetical protein
MVPGPISEPTIVYIWIVTSNLWYTDIDWKKSIRIILAQVSDMLYVHIYESCVLLIKEKSSLNSELSKEKPHTTSHNRDHT